MDGVMRLGDGRRLAWREYGCPDGAPLLALHGLPGSRLLFEVAGGVAHELGIRLVAPDRWGYGDTDPHPAPTLSAFATDMALLADHLAIERFSVMGVSGGGPYAAAVASCLPQRTLATALVAPVGPMSGEKGLDIGVFHGFCFGPFARSPRFGRGVFAGFRRLITTYPRAGMAVAMSRVPACDGHVLADGMVRDRLARAFVEGLRPGPGGPVIDMTLFGRAWDLPLHAARAPARLWLGTQDRHVPLSAARRLAEHLPACELVEMVDEGHLWVALNYGVVLRWALEMQKGAASATPSLPESSRLQPQAVARPPNIDGK